MHARWLLTRRLAGLAAVVVALTGCGPKATPPPQTPPAGSGATPTTAGSPSPAGPFKSPDQLVVADLVGVWVGDATDDQGTIHLELTLDANQTGAFQASDGDSGALEWRLDAGKFIMADAPTDWRAWEALTPAARRSEEALSVALPSAEVMQINGFTGDSMTLSDELIAIRLKRQ